MDEGSDDTGTVLATQINLLKEIKRNTVVKVSKKTCQWNFWHI